MFSTSHKFHRDERAPISLFEAGSSPVDHSVKKVEILCQQHAFILTTVIVLSNVGIGWAQTPFPDPPERGSRLGISVIPDSIEPIPQRPNYTHSDCWSLLPSSCTEAEALEVDHELALPRGLRSGGLTRLADSLQADVFFIHPTMYLEGIPWNADVRDEKMNDEVDHWPIRHQASAFSGAGRVFAPRYRQAHIRIFDIGDSLSWAAANIAYQDVREAFLHYMENWNEGRPIILAGHSQGSFHGRTLLQEFFDQGPYQNLLVAAYLPGMDMYANEFHSIPLCEQPNQIGCLCTWMTYGDGYRPPWLVRKMDQAPDRKVMCTHPVTWHASERNSTLQAHLGVVRPSYRQSKPHVIEAHISPEGVLWIGEPKVIGGRWLQRENWHSGDINFLVQHFCKRPGEDFGLACWTFLSS